MIDASLKEMFTLKVIIFVTITDYPGLFSLSGQIKGKTGYVVCIDSTCYTYLNASKKLVYMRHRRFLSKKHKYQASSMNKYFDNQEEHELHETKRTNYEKYVDGKKKMKKRKRDKMEEEPAASKVPFKKQSCFFRYLLY
jgi:hypothetical protein